MSSDQPRFDFGAAEETADDRDQRARRLAVDPRRNVALEASAGTGKTRVLVDRYVALLAAGVPPRNILAITFTRKAAAEMRQRILDSLASRHREGTLPAAVWQELRDHAGEISISTIDAFCLALLREFPLEADVDPGFDLADETDQPRLVEEALDRTLALGRHLALDDADIALLFAALGEGRVRLGLARLIDRRLVAWDALNRFVRRADVTADAAGARLLARLRAAFATQPGGVQAFVLSGPVADEFALLTQDLRALITEPDKVPAYVLRSLLERLGTHLLTQKGEPRKKLDYTIKEFRSRGDYDRHRAAVLALGPYVVDAIAAYRADLNLVLARGVRRLFAIAQDEYRRTLQKENVLDFSDVLQRTLALLRQMDEFSRSRFRLESRYQHVLVDEFQDTSRAQWELVELLVRAWQEGEGLEGVLPPSIFIVGDRKQSIYAFRDAEVAVLDAAADYIDALRPIVGVRQAITRSFRSTPVILRFINDVFAAIEKRERPDAFRYDERDVFPVDVPRALADPPIALACGLDETAQAEAVAEEIARLLTSGATVRDKERGVPRAVQPGDIAILFRTRDGHQAFERALEERRVPFYVYKGLGFFDADEIKDVLALLGWLSMPASNLRAAAFLRSRIVRLSDRALRVLAPSLSEAILGEEPPAEGDLLEPDDRQRLDLLRRAAPTWLSLVDRLSPAELLDRIVSDTAYAAEIRGGAVAQARENLKKVRALVRRMQNRGYATMARLVDYFSGMVAGGDESNAIVDAANAVNLMTVHAAKGLEFPVVFVVNLGKASGGGRDPIRVALPPFGQDDDDLVQVAIGDHESAADRDDEAREAEETKRLLYVAMTRARDRLYLGAALAPDGRFLPGKGSLARLLPPSLTALVERAGQPPLEEGDVLEWSGDSGSHRLAVIRPPLERPVVFASPAASDGTTEHFAPLTTRRAAIRRGVVREIGATAHPPSLAEPTATDATPRPDEDDNEDDESRSLVGLLVHRALAARLGIGDSTNVDVGTAEMITLLTDDERAGRMDVVGATRRAAEGYRQLIARDDVRALLTGARLLHEVAFSRRAADGRVIRGVIDCIAVRDARADVLEIKTGRPRAAHAQQLEWYVAAARAALGDLVVQGHLVYLTV